MSKSDAKLILSEAARRMDDRLPGQTPDSEILELLDLIDFSGIEDAHVFPLYKKDFPRDFSVFDLCLRKF